MGRLLILYQLVLFLAKAVVFMEVLVEVVGTQVKVEEMAVRVAHTFGVVAVVLVAIVETEEILVDARASYQQQDLVVVGLVEEQRGLMVSQAAAEVA
jgi:hypothetical protein